MCLYPGSQGLFVPPSDKALKIARFLRVTIYLNAVSSVFPTTHAWTWIIGIFHPIHSETWCKRLHLGFVSFTDGDASVVRCAQVRAYGCYRLYGYKEWRRVQLKFERAFQQKYMPKTSFSSSMILQVFAKFGLPCLSTIGSTCSRCSVIVSSRVCKCSGPVFRAFWF